MGRLPRTRAAVAELFTPEAERIVHVLLCRRNTAKVAEAKQDVGTCLHYLALKTQVVGQPYVIRVIERYQIVNGGPYSSIARGAGSAVCGFHIPDRSTETRNYFAGMVG
jgi:hypothetical protein